MTQYLRITCRFYHTLPLLRFTAGLKDLPSMDFNLLVHEKKDLHLGGEGSSSNKSSLALIRSGVSRHTTTKQDVVRRSLDQLPIGILHKVVDHLDLVALVCLKCSNRHFYTSISIDPSLLSVCIRWLIHIHFLNDNPTQLMEKACMLCKVKRKHRRFRDRDQRFILEGPSIPYSEGHRKDPIIREKISHNYLATKQWDWDDKWIPTEWTLMNSTTILFYKIPEPPKSLIESHVNYTLDHIYYFTHGHPQKLDSKSLYRWCDDSEGQCYDHLMEQFGLNKTIDALLPLIQLPLKPMWLRFTVLRCAHCGRCVEEGDSRLYGCLNCCCNVCHRLISHQHYRTGPRRTPNPQIRRISMDEKGVVWIHEVGSKSLTITMRGGL